MAPPNPQNIIINDDAFAHNSATIQHLTGLLQAAMATNEQGNARFKAMQQELMNRVQQGKEAERVLEQLSAGGSHLITLPEQAKSGNLLALIPTAPPATRFHTEIPSTSRIVEVNTSPQHAPPHTATTRPAAPIQTQSQPYQPRPTTLLQPNGQNPIPASQQFANAQQQYSIPQSQQYWQVPGQQQQPTTTSHYVDRSKASRPNLPPARPSSSSLSGALGPATSTFVPVDPSGQQTTHYLPKPRQHRKSKYETQVDLSTSDGVVNISRVSTNPAGQSLQVVDSQGQSSGWVALNQDSLAEQQAYKMPRQTLLNGPWLATLNTPSAAQSSVSTAAPSIAMPMARLLPLVKTNGGSTSQPATASSLVSILKANIPKNQEPQTVEQPTPDNLPTSGKQASPSSGLAGSAQANPSEQPQLKQPVAAQIAQQSSTPAENVAGGQSSSTATDPTTVSRGNGPSNSITGNTNQAASSSSANADESSDLEALQWLRAESFKHAVGYFKLPNVSIWLYKDARNALYGVEPDGHGGFRTMQPEVLRGHMRTAWRNGLLQMPEQSATYAQAQAAQAAATGEQAQTYRFRAYDGPPTTGPQTPTAQPNAAAAGGKEAALLPSGEARSPANADKRRLAHDVLRALGRGHLLKRSWDESSGSVDGRSAKRQALEGLSGPVRASTAPSSEGPVSSPGSTPSRTLQKSSLAIEGANGAYVVPNTVSTAGNLGQPPQNGKASPDTVAPSDALQSNTSTPNSVPSSTLARESPSSVTTQVTYAEALTDATRLAESYMSKHVPNGKSTPKVLPAEQPPVSVFTALAPSSTPKSHSQQPNAIPSTSSPRPSSPASPQTPTAAGPSHAPLFLPSPSSSASSPRPAMDVSEHGSTPGADVDDDNMSIEMGALDEAMAGGATGVSYARRGAREGPAGAQRVYVLVPPAPKWVVRFQERERERAAYRKRVGKQRESEGARRTRLQAANSAHFSSPYATTNTIERITLQEASVRLHACPCQWRGCDVVMNSMARLAQHLKQHQLEQDAQLHYPCLWVGCGRKFPSAAKLSAHIESHAYDPIYCAYKGCPHTFQAPRELVQHILASHKNDALLPTPDPFRPPLAALDEPPLTMPAYMVEARRVQPASISPEQHRVLGPQILQKIYGPVGVRGGVPARGQRRMLEPLRPAGHDEYEFLDADVPRPRRRGKRKELVLDDLNSAEMSQLISEGLVFWPAPDQGTVDGDDEVVLLAAAPAAEAQGGNQKQGRDAGDDGGSAGDEDAVATMLGARADAVVE